MLTLGATLVWMLVAAPQPLAVLHALALGVFLTIALGLLYQFVPVVARRTLRMPTLAFVHLACAASGTALVVEGFATLDFTRVAVGGALHALGFALEIAVLAATVVGTRPPAAASGALASLAWLVAALAFGIAAAARLADGIAVAALARAHAIAALAGFFATLIVAISLRLARMFERVDRESRIGALAFAAHLAALAALAFRAGAIALACAGALFATEFTRIGRARAPAYQRETFWYALVSCIGGIVACAALWYEANQLAIVCALWLFVGTAVVGYLQRIVPFIAWIARARRDGARATPSLAAMNASALGYAILVCWTAAGIAFTADPRSRIGASIAMLAWIGLVTQLARAFLLRRPSPANP
ncbi:MAG: hypothetical protein KGN02_11310 [bacterium]|nr:hypothetical protein [bacterium]